MQCGDMSFVPSAERSGPVVVRSLLVIKKPRPPVWTRNASPTLWTRKAGAPMQPRDSSDAIPMNRPAIQLRKCTTEVFEETLD
jgi:hypothetical protein